MIIGTTPFYSVLLKLLEEANNTETYFRSNAERKMLIDCLSFVPKSGNSSSQETELIDVKIYSKAHFGSMPKLEGFERCGLNPILKDTNEEKYTNTRNIEKDKLVNFAASEKAAEEIKTQPYCPNFLRPVPEVDPYLEDSIVEDAIWLFPGVLPEPCWDYTLGNNSSRVKTLMKKSLNGPLKKSNIDLITMAMKNDPEAVIHYGIHSDNLSKLVIHNKDLALEFLNAMSPYPIIIEYYNALAQTKVNLNSMELFNKLVQNHDLPKEYILYYIYNCFESCKDTESVGAKAPTGSDHSSKYVYQTRLVRLVSIVIGFLLKNKVIPVEEIMKIKAEEFFNEHSNVKEAAQILKQIKSSK